MCAMKSKKLVILAILDILRKYTDADHRLSQSEIIRILRYEYEMDVDRKTVKRNILDLIDGGYDIAYSESLRMTPGKDGQLEETYILSDFYLIREFTDGELRLLIDSLLFSKHVPHKQCKELAEKLAGLSNQHFKAHIRYIATLPDNKPKNAMLFYVIEQLDDAIANKKQVAIQYGNYGKDKVLRARRLPDGTAKTYIFNPYQMAATNGRYYLIGNFDRYDDTANLRLDRIMDIHILDTPAKPVKEVRGMEHGLQLPKHMAEHLYMFEGESVPVTFRMHKTILNDVMDWFGSDITFCQETENTLTARVTVNYHAMRYWALQYARHVQVLTPENLTRQIREDLEDALKKYSS